MPVPAPIETVIRFVDDYMDKDAKTIDRFPGKVFGNKLICIGKQTERRIFGRRKIKHIIFVAESTRDLWYKTSFDAVGVIAMGFSLKTLMFHKSAMSMEEYARIFLDGADPFFLKRNDYELGDFSL